MNNEDKILEILSELCKGQAEMRSDMAELKADVAGLKTDVAELKADVAALKTDVAELQANVAELQSNVAELQADMADMKADVAELQADMAELQTTVYKIDERSKRTQILLETDYEKKIQALFDGHMEIMQKIDDLAPMSRVEAVEGDVTTLEHVTKMLRQDIRELQKAQ